VLNDRHLKISKCLYKQAHNYKGNCDSFYYPPASCIPFKATLKYQATSGCFTEGFAMLDLQQVFFGDTTLTILLEIVFRTTVMYLYLLVLLRSLGARGIGQLSPFEFAIIIALGSAVGDSMFYLDIPLIECLLVITVVVLLQHLIVWASNRNARLEELLEGKPYTLVENVILNTHNMYKNALSHDEVFMQLRGKGAEQLGQVKSAYLEVSGQTSVFLLPEEIVRPGLPIVPPWEISRPEEMTTDQAAPENGYYACSNCGNTIYIAKDTTLQTCSVCQKQKWMRASSIEVDTQNG
jgi:uncharacterized membrane protein YcaP (DUF421 family)